MRVTAILKGSPDKFGRQTITIRINQGDGRTFTATKMKVTPDQFQDGKVVKHPQAQLFNQNIKNLILQVELRSMQGPTGTYPDADFFAYARACIRAWEGEKSGKTIEVHLWDLSKLSQYREKFNLTDINADFLNGYKAWMKKRGNGHNTIWHSLQFLQTVVNKAVGEKVIREAPWENFVFPRYKAPKKVYLTAEQIAQVEAYALTMTEPARYVPVVCWFVIGCLTGLRFGDMQAFREEKHVRSGRLVLYTSKTNEVVSLPISDRVRALLERVGWQGVKETNNFCNYAIKATAKKLDIEVDISFHSSRHSFAVFCASSGISQEVCAKFLGHTDLKTTALYYKLTGSRTDDEYKRAFG